MSRVGSSTIKEITKEIMLGNICYLHRTSKKVTTINHSIEDPKLIAIQEQKQAELERKIKHYIKIENLSAEDQDSIMDGFLEEPLDKSVQKQLINALNRKNPSRNFNQVIESDIGLKQQWKSFSFEESQQWVYDFIVEAYRYGK